VLPPTLVDRLQSSPTHRLQVSKPLHFAPTNQLTAYELIVYKSPPMGYNNRNTTAYLFNNHIFNNAASTTALQLRIQQLCIQQPPNLSVPHLLAQFTCATYSLIFFFNNCKLQHLSNSHTLQLRVTSALPTNEDLSYSTSTYPTRQGPHLFDKCLPTVNYNFWQNKTFGRNKTFGQNFWVDSLVAIYAKRTLFWGSFVMEDKVISRCQLLL
jgi:hypothetical protein